MKLAFVQRSRPRSAITRALVGLALVGWAGIGIGFGTSARETLHSYLFAYTFCLTIAVGALILLGIWHAVNAVWPVVIRRQLEAMATTVSLLAVLFVPILVGAPRLYPWAMRSATLDRESRELVLHQRPYMNETIWIVRSAGYFIVWIVIAETLFALSKRQDSAGGLRLTTQQRRLGVAGLPLVAFAFSFAILDWTMAIEPSFSSTIFALYVWCGGFLGAIAVATLVLVLDRAPDAPGAYANANHRAALAQLLLAFCAFWAYLAFDQYMVVWIANLPREVDWYLVRTTHGWGRLGVAALGAKFLLPFLMLLPRRTKTHAPVVLAVVAALILVGHLLDMFWIVLPAIHRTGLTAGWQDVAATVGLVALCAAFVRFRLRDEYAIPIGDPYLERSFRFDEK